MRPEDKRKTARFEMRVPIMIAAEGIDQPVVGITRDLSASGLFFYGPAHLAHLPTVELVMTFPPEITLVKSLKVRCKTQILRVETSDSEKAGFAAHFIRYEFVKAAEVN
jgi:hypothetical protein